MKNFILELQGETWMDNALCRSSSSDLFFPVGRSQKTQKKIEEALVICTECSVTPECLDYALRTNQDIGIWGGTIDEDRKYLRRKYKLTKFAS